MSANGAWGQKLWKIFNSFGAANEPAHKEKNTLWAGGLLDLPAQVVRGH